MVGEEWPTVEGLQSLGLLLVEDGNHGEYRPRPDEFSQRGVAFVRAADLSDGAVDFERCEHVNASAVARIRKGIGRPRDILLSHKGTVGKLARVPADAPPFVCSPQTTFWRVLDETKVDRGYLYAFMRSRLFESQLLAVQGETDMAPYVSLTAQRRLKIALPTPGRQAAIGDFLGALDDKLELNHRMAQTLEAMARALFKSWFVDFDPVHAKADRRPTGLPDETAALFPDRFGEDGLPDGWEQRTLGSKLATTIVRGLAPAYADNGVLVLNQRCIRDSRIDMTKIRRHDDSVKRVTEERFLRVGDIVINSTGVGTLGRVAQVLRLPEAMTADSHVTIVRPNTDEISANLLGLSLIYAEPYIETLGLGSTGQTELSRDAIAELMIVMADQRVRHKFDEIVIPTRDRVCQALEEITALTMLRDTLLPKLISGELSITAAANGTAAA